ncbi:MAG: acyltransferase family protein [Thermoplasmatota archaeon]
MSARMHGLTRLRFLLALWVVLFHYRPAAGAPLPGLATAFLEAGYLGVPFFFVLSGFVLASAYPSGSLSDGAGVRRFAVRRFARLYPGFFLAVAAFAVLQLAAHLAGLPTEFDPRANLAALPLTLLGLHAWLPSAACAWNCPSWPLSVEFAFYAAFPFLLRLSPRQRLLAGGLVTVASIALLAGAPGLPDEVLIFNPAMNLASFLLGMLLRDWDLGSSAQARRVAGFVAPVAVLALVAANALLHDKAALNGVGAWFAVCPTVVAFSRPSAAPDRSLLTRLGEASFALYIWHIPLRMVFQGAGVVAGLRTGTLAFEAVAAATAVLASLALYRWVEVPAERLLVRRLLPSRPAPTLDPSSPASAGQAARPAAFGPPVPDAAQASASGAIGLPRRAGRRRLRGTAGGG